MELLQGNSDVNTSKPDSKRRTNRRGRPHSDLSLKQVAKISADSNLALGMKRQGAKTVIPFLWTYFICILALNVPEIFIALCKWYGPIGSLFISHDILFDMV